MDAFGQFDKQQEHPEGQWLTQSLLSSPASSGAVVYWNWGKQQNAKLMMTASCVLALPIGLREGRMAGLYVLQSGAGGFTITWSSGYKNVSTLTLQSTAGYANQLTFRGMSDTTCELVGNYVSTRA